MLTPQLPAEGIIKHKGWHDANVYHLECTCTDPDHAVEVWIEINPDTDMGEIKLSMFAKTVYTESWKGIVERVKDAIGILCGRPMVRSHGLLLTEQGAVNLAAAITKSVEDLNAVKQSDE